MLPKRVQNVDCHPCKKQCSAKSMTRLGLDPRTLSVLTIRDNQLHHPANLMEDVFVVDNIIGQLTSLEAWARGCASNHSLWCLQFHIMGVVFLCVLGFVSEKWVNNKMLVDNPSVPLESHE